MELALRGAWRTMLKASTNISETAMATIRITTGSRFTASPLHRKAAEERQIVRQNRKSSENQQRAQHNQQSSAGQFQRVHVRPEAAVKLEEPPNPKRGQQKRDGQPHGVNRQQQ